MKNLRKQRRHLTDVRLGIGFNGLLIWAMAMVLLSGQCLAGTVVSNLNESNQTTVSIKNDLWMGSLFQLGGMQDYRLDSITAKFGASSGSVSDFTASVYSDSGGVFEELEALSGNLPSSEENHEFTSSGLTLEAGTYYWLVFKSSDSGGSFTPFVAPDSVGSGDGNWQLHDEAQGSSDHGDSWGSQSVLGSSLRSSSFVYSIQATPVPEPHEYAVLAGISLAGFVVFRRRFQGGQGSAAA